MIVIKVELHNAQTGEVTDIGRMHIWNKGDGTLEVGNYEGTTFRKGSVHVSRRGGVLGYPRRRLNIWHLLSRMLTNMGYK